MITTQPVRVTAKLLRDAAAVIEAIKAPACLDFARDARGDERCLVVSVTGLVKHAEFIRLDGAGEFQRIQ